MDFRPGDVVLCIDDEDATVDFGVMLRKGNEYIVEKWNALGVRVEGIDFAFFERRFVVVKRPCSCPANAFRCTCQ